MYQGVEEREACCALFPANESDAGQSWVSVSSCIQNRAVSTSNTFSYLGMNALAAFQKDAATSGAFLHKALSVQIVSC